MPEDKATIKGLATVLDHLADYTLNTHNYQTIHKALEAEDNVQIEVVEKLLLICIRGLKEDMKYTVNTLNIILCIVKKVSAGKCSLKPDLVPSALAVLHLLKTTALFSKVEALKILCFDVLMEYPKETLISLAVDQSTEFLELFNSYCNQRIPMDIRIQTIRLLGILLRILSCEKRRQFVKEGVSTWFSKIIPTIVTCINVQNTKTDVPIETLEILTEELMYVDYIDNPHWQIILECIYTPQRYPFIMKSLLEKDESVWYRLWIVFIKLLKTQITKVNNSIGSPINSMLPVVEMAFKMDPKNRCRAFLCWNVLIDNFSSETSDAYINKRIKLLIIPLSSNNAKVVETAVAKLNTWWYLIVKFRSKIENIADSVLIPFIHFCFGKPNTDKPMLIPGTFSDEIKVKCVETIVEMFGHNGNCECSVSVHKLGDKLISQNLLVNHWKEWIHSINNVIKICVRNDSKVCQSYLECIWFGLLSTIGEITDDKLKKDLYYEVINFTDNLTLGASDKMAEIIILILIPILFDKDERIRTLKIRDEKRQIEQKVISMISKLPKEALAVRNEAIIKLRNVTDHILAEKSPQILQNIEQILKEVPSKGLLMWTALAQSVSKLNCKLTTKVISSILTTPLEDLSTISQMPETKSTWLEMYNCTFKKSINDDIIKTLLNQKDEQKPNDFVIQISIALLNQKLKNDAMMYNKEVEFLHKILNMDWTKPINLQSYLENIVKIATNIFKRLVKADDNKTCERIINITNIALKYILLSDVFKDGSSPSIVNSLIDIFRSMELKLNAEKYPILTVQMINELKEIGTKLVLLLEPLVTDKNEFSITDIKEFFSVSNLNGKVGNKNNSFEHSIEKFTEPEIKAIPKKSKKKSMTIVNTVIDGGEEYVVVKSNWKFNPKKLTDNQKEKLQRKREDIPALYQDLSQSQDEFKLTAWKADSQDTSSTSKSTSVAVSVTDDLSMILKNIPNSEIVPNILENIKCNENLENNEAINKLDSLKSDECEIAEKHSKQIMPLTKDTKSPRMALKDRVFRNVRNLIEKSSLSDGNKSLNNGVGESDPKTPISNKSCDTNALINSAPSKICIERPSRMKRKPKKFDDLEIFSLKKRRLSLGTNDSSPDSLDIENGEIDINTKSSCEMDKANEEKQVTVNVDENVEVSLNYNKKEKLDISEPIVETKETESEIETEVKIQTEPTSHIETNIDIKNAVQIKVDKLIDTVKPIESLNNEESENKVLLPKVSNTNKEPDTLKSSTKKKSSRRSRIEKELAIDTVEGHPLLNAQAEKRITRKSISNTLSTRKNLSDKIHKSKQDPKANKIERRSKDKDKLHILTDKVINLDDSPLSQDFIESSQDSTITTISLKSSISAKKVPIVLIVDNLKYNTNFVETQNSSDPNEVKSIQSETKNNDDTVIPRNKTAVEVEDFIDLTENIDTEAKTKLNVADNEVEDFIDLTENIDAEAKTKINVADNGVSSICVNDELITLECDNTEFDSQNMANTDTFSASISTNVVNVDNASNLDIHNRDDADVSNSHNVETQDLSSESQDIASADIESMQNIDTQNTKTGDSQNEDSRRVQNILYANSLNADEIAVLINDDGDTENTANADTLNTASADTLNTTNADIQNSSKAENLNNTNVDTLNTFNNDSPHNTPKHDQNVSNADIQNIGNADVQNVINADTQNVTNGDTQNTANADTESMDLDFLPEINLRKVNLNKDIMKPIDNIESNNVTINSTVDDSTQSLDNIENDEKSKSSPFKDEQERNKDFISNTLEISPIKTLSPIEDKKSSSPETSRDYVVIKFTSPVQSNGEPFDKCDSPEIFTEDKVSPDKRDMSPPREVAPVTHTSPSSSLSLKKNRPQVRSGGRAAHMLGLCVPNRQQTQSEKSADLEEKKTTINSSARRNLRISYGASMENNEIADDKNESENFLKLRRTLPSTDCSPSGPILKRKLVEILDEATFSPASKRKRVSFHDPPVSTTICVKKYIEPCGIRSPQNSAIKRQERQIRSQIATKSPKRLDNLFKLDTVLTKTIESFIDVETPTSEDTELCSLDPTPIAEIVKPSELNDTDPICLELVNCTDSIEVIASELSSPSMKSLLVKELQGKIDTVGDLAKMTEIEINRLCIKAPKVQVVKTVLTEYAQKIRKANEEITPTVEAAMSESIVPEFRAIEVQTKEILMDSVAIQTDALRVLSKGTQSDTVCSSHCFVQTEESGSRSTSDIVKSCLSEREDFVEQLCEQTDETIKKKIVDDLPINALTDLLAKKMSSDEFSYIFNRIIDHRSSLDSTSSEDKRLVVLQKYMSETFDPKDLILFCSDLLKKAHTKIT